MSASELRSARASSAGTKLTAKEANVVREFVEKGKAIENSFNGELLSLATKVKAIFASKEKGMPVLFEGRPYKTFDSFVEENFPICGRTMRRWLAKEGKTNTKFANKQQPDPLPESAQAGNPEQQRATATTLAGIIAETEARIRSALGYPCDKPLPEILVRAYEAGRRDGYLAALVDSERRKGRA
jgi:hypothetical protein